MRITTQGDYALRCILNIARHQAQGPVSIRFMVAEERLPLDYVEQLLMKLRRRKLIKSVRGVNGGYLLDKKPSLITVKDVIEAVEGDVFEMICSRRQERKLKKCIGSDACVLKSLWYGLKSTIENYLTDETLATLIAKKL
jgi:Rrf2 family protein